MYLIVGIDPGTTTGIAILNFKGELVNLFSSKDFGIDRVIEHLIPLGKVSIISTDVNPAPEFVSKLVTKLGSRLFLPEESLKIEEKIRLSRNYNTKNSHERDALSSAINAFNKFSNKFRKIELLGYGDDVKHRVIKGISIENAIEGIKEEEVVPEKSEIIQPEAEISGEERRIRSLEKQSLRLREIISEKEKEIKRLRLVISDIRKRYDFKIRKINPKFREFRSYDFPEENHIKKSAESEYIIKSLEITVDNLNERLKDIDKLTELWKRASGKEVIPVGVFPEITSGIVLIKKRLKEQDLEGLRDIEIAFVQNPSDRKYLKGKGIIVADLGYVKEISGCFYITVEDLNKIREMEKISLDGIIEDYRRGRTN